MKYTHPKVYKGVRNTPLSQNVRKLFIEENCLKCTERFKVIAEQDPKTGHWIRVAGGSLIDDYRCDICQSHPPKKIIRNTWGWDFTKYCPNCGTKMESEEI